MSNNVDTAEIKGVDSLVRFAHVLSNRCGCYAEPHLGNYQWTGVEHILTNSVSTAL